MRTSPARVPMSKSPVGVSRMEKISVSGRMPLAAAALCGSAGEHHQPGVDFMKSHPQASQVVLENSIRLVARHALGFAIGGEGIVA